MTDTEIIKALECCTTKGAKCSDCPAFKKVDRSDCKKYFRGAIDLINSQKANTERHAHWVAEERKPYYMCSNCRGNALRFWFEPESQLSDYCPHCGCKMDEVVE